MKTKLKTRSVPKEGSPRLFVAALLMLLGGAATAVMNGPMKEFFQTNYGFGDRKYTSFAWDMFWELGVPPMAWGVFFAAAGILLLWNRKRGTLPAAAFVLILLGAILGMNDTDGVMIFLIAAGLLMLLSARGSRLNVALCFLPEPVRIPLFNLIAALLALPHVVFVIGNMGPSVFSLLGLLPVLGLLLLNLSVTAQAVDPSQAEERQALPRLQAVPREGSRAFALGALLVVVYSASEIVMSLVSGGMGLSMAGYLQKLLLLAMGVLMLYPETRKKRYIPAVALVVAGLVINSFAYGAYGGISWNYFLIPVLMLISAIGVSWNTAVKKVPVLNLLVVALTLWNGGSYLFRIFKSLAEGHEVSVGNILLILMYYVGLILINLCLDTREIPARERCQVDSEKYKKGFAGLVQRFYSDVGGGLQFLAKIQGAICLAVIVLAVAVAALALVGALLSMMGNGDMVDTCLMLLLCCGGAVLVCLIGIVATWPLYAFGQITSDIHALKENGIAVVGAAAAPASPLVPMEDNPDQLPEL